MDPSQQKEQFSFAYVRAVAAAAGYGVSEPSVDDDSVDLLIASRSTAGTVKRPRLEVQVKCTADDLLTTETFSYPLKIKNYNDLRDPDVLVPRILVVVRVPDNVAEWSEVTDEQLLLRRCGYWLSLRGRPETDNENTVSITMQRDNRFTAESLAAMMKRIGAGDSP